MAGWKMDHSQVIFLLKPFHLYRGFSSQPCLMKREGTKLFPGSENQEDFSAKKCLDAVEQNPPYVQPEEKTGWGFSELQRSDPGNRQRGSKPEI